MYHCSYCKKEITDKARIRGFRSGQKTRNQTRIFCNKECWRLGWHGENNPLWKGRTLIEHCPQCKTDYERKYRQRPQTYCSQQCSKEASRKNRTYQCDQCGEEFSRKSHEFRKSHKFYFCSKECSSNFHSGENHHDWKNGISGEFKKIRATEEYKVWQKEVYKRDGWTCRICSNKPKDIVAHHIKSFADYPELRFIVNNGITFCRSCHAKIHGILRTLRDYTLGFSQWREEDIVRSPWRHGEISRNDLSHSLYN